MRKYVNDFSVMLENGENVYYGPYVSIHKDRIVFPGDKEYPDTMVTVNVYNSTTGEEEERLFATRSKQQMGI